MQQNKMIMKGSRPTIHWEQCMGLNSSVGTAQSAALTLRPWVRIPLKSQHFFLELICNYVKLIVTTTATIISSFKFAFLQFTSSSRLKTTHQ